MTSLHRMHTRRHALAVLGGAAALAVAPAFAQRTQAFPNRPIRIVVPYPAGGATDILARAIGQKLAEQWGQPVVVENKPGAAGWTGMQQVAKSPPDGYTLGLTISSIIYAKSLYAKPPFDMQADFEPVTLVSRTPVALVVPPNSPANTLEEFVAYARSNPGKLNYGSFGQGTSSHIFGETLNLAARLDLVHAAYKGAAPVVTDLVGGQLTSAYLDTGTLRPLLNTGKLKVLAVSGTQRVSAMPNVPTFLEKGYKGFEPVGFFQVLAPAQTPKDIVRKLSDAMVRAVRSEDLRARMLDMGQDPGGSTPEELATAIRVDAEIFDRAIKASNIRVEQN
ncbi:Bug family tripartite tricarboxylate transporter substrate binding protein [Pseudorhodoferax sp.]|uniref:Bug family tripartite tricarboxylate transporter substrate binding protein n=1 Tax=Pseudorhodoferax sp. TaxID=1993553 RepID=UPI002DD6B232|nr:tripartite tricarboxylate transporter substrate binding protein [Pseudorhodoferax sp.]